MWNRIAKYLETHPERLFVAKLLVENGLSVRNGKIYCNEIEIPPIRIARVSKVDRRTVTETIKAIEENPDLQV
ncbi:amino acid-binding ACT domain protein, partial [bacterium]